MTTPTFTMARCSTCLGRLLDARVDSPATGRQFYCERCGDEVDEATLITVDEVYPGASVILRQDKTYPNYRGPSLVTRVGPKTITVEFFPGVMRRKRYADVLRFADTDDYR